MIRTLIKTLCASTPGLDLGPTAGLTLGAQYVAGLGLGSVLKKVLVLREARPEKPTEGWFTQSDRLLGSIHDCVPDRGHQP